MAWGSLALRPVARQRGARLGFRQFIRKGTAKPHVRFALGETYGVELLARAVDVFLWFRVSGLGF